MTTPNKRKLEDKCVTIWANTYGDLFLNVYNKNSEGHLALVETLKFDGNIDNVDLEISIPPKCRKEYAKIIKMR